MEAKTIETTAAEKIPVGNRLVFVLSLAGFAVAAYLWWLESAGAEIPCGSSGGCAEVAASPYARFLGIPVAAFGSGLYLLLAALAFARSLAGSSSTDRLLLRAIIAGAGIGALFSLGLTYLEFFVIHAVCRWCLASQVIILAILAVAVRDGMRRVRESSPT